VLVFIKEAWGYVMVVFDPAEVIDSFYRNEDVLFDYPPKYNI
jgi:hypothetical protein